MTSIQLWNGEYLEQSLEDLLKEITSSIKQGFPECEIILFGSYARGDYSKDSDLDICVLVPEITYNRSDMRVDIACLIRDDFPLPFDVLLYTYDEFNEYSRIKSRLQYQIKHEGVVLSA